MPWEQETPAHLGPADMNANVSPKLTPPQKSAAGGRIKKWDSQVQDLFLDTYEVDLRRQLPEHTANTTRQN